MTGFSKHTLMVRDQELPFGLSMVFDFDVYLIEEVTSAGDEKFRNKSKEI